MFLMGSATLSFAITDDRIFTCYLSLFAIGFLHFLRLRRGMSSIELLFWAALFSLETLRSVGSANAMVGMAALIGLSIPWPRLPLLSSLGLISYSLYLVHLPAGSWVIDHADAFPQALSARVCFLILAIALSVFVAYVFWFIVERPSVAAAHKVGPRERVDPSEAW
jgi:peptidoglycan/LPS O-acetylase OafA/YrhL